MSEVPSPNQLPASATFHGVAVSPGVATGPVVIIRQDRLTVRKRKINPEEIEAELARFEEALLKTRLQILEVKNRLAASIGEKDAAIFDAHLLVVEDSTILQVVKAQLAERLICVDFIYQEIAKKFTEQMMQVDDEYLRERANDIKDVSARVIRNLRGAQDNDKFILDGPSVVLADSLTLSDLVSMDRHFLLGFATEQGSKTSHAVILARSLNIPAVIGLREALYKVEGGTEVLLDGLSGLLIVSPNEQTKYEYGRLEQRRHEVEVKLEEIRDTLASTKDNRRITVSANIELPEDLPLVIENGAEGIGLYRTEFLFLDRDDFPSEDEQTAIYAQVASAVKPHSLIIRTLDVGGDKMPTSFLTSESEMNPFLGWRGIRLCLDRVDIFRTQLRAILRATPSGHVRLMFPMITEAQELRRAKIHLQEVREELQREGFAIAEKVECGVMIEVPSAALTADILAREVDFFSIGTNDLIQYTLAVDRLNEKVANLYQPTHPAVLRLIARVVEAAHLNKIWVGICGEMANDILLTPLLVGLGIDELSMGSVFIPRVKKAIQSLSYFEVERMSRDLLNYSTPEEITRHLEQFARVTYPDLLIA